MKKAPIYLIIFLLITLSCRKENNNENSNTEIKGYDLLNDLKGHWVGSNKTAFGNFDWFTFDFRPISASHLHSIYEGATNQNIITSIFIADYNGEMQIMARNGGWLGPQYRATYFVLDKATTNENSKYYRLVDAIGGRKRSYMEFRFENGKMEFDAYKDNSGSLDEPIHHMGFTGTNYNPSFAITASNFFNFPQKISEVNLEKKFVNLIDSNSALFLEESKDPFPKSQHTYLSDLKINIVKENVGTNDDLLLYISLEPIVDIKGTVDFENLDTKVVRTINVQSNEDSYTTTYLHPDLYYLTIFSDKDNNLFPSKGDISCISKEINVKPELLVETTVNVNLVIQ